MVSRVEEGGLLYEVTIAYSYTVTRRVWGMFLFYSRLIVSEVD